MRVLFSLQPATGHLQPIAPIATALQRNGHDVRFACSKAFHSTLERFDFHPVEVGLNWLRGDSVSAFPPLADLPANEHYDWVLREVYAGRALKASLRDLQALTSDWKPDLIIRDQVEFASWLVAEEINVPHVSFGYGLGFQEVDRLRIADKLDTIAAAMGLSTNASVASLFRYPRLEFAPPSYLPPEAPDVAHRWHVQYQPRDASLRNHEAFRPVRPKQRPLVVLTLGTNYNRHSDVFQRVMTALSGKPIDLLITLGRTPRPGEFTNIPDNTRLVEFLPLSQLLPDADAIICHAGFNTMMTAVLSSTPMLLLPIDSDQPAQAVRGEALGLGICLDAKQPAADEIPRSLDRLMTDKSYKANIEDFRQQVLDLPDATDVAHRLVRWAGQASGGAASELDASDLLGPAHRRSTAARA